MFYIYIIIYTVVILLFGRVILKKRIRKEQLALERTKNRFEAMVEHGSDAVIIIAPPDKLLYVSKSIKNILGYNQSELMENDLMGFIHPNDLEGSLKAIEHSINNPGITISGYTSRVKHKNGSWRWLESRVTNLLHDPAVQGIVDNFRDVTAQVLAEAELKDTARRLKLANSTSKIGIWDYDLLTSKLIWDERMFDIYGLEQDSAACSLRFWLHRIVEKDRKVFKEIDQKVRKGKREFNAQFSILLPDGEIKTIYLLAVVECNASKEPIRIVGTNHDVTERQKYLETIEEILYDISHKIRKPVTNIIGLAGLIEEYDDDLMLQKNIKFIKDASVELSDFTIAINKRYLEKRKSYLANGLN